MKSKLALFGLLFTGLMLTAGRPVFAHGYPHDTKPAAHALTTSLEHFHHLMENVTGFSHLAQDVLKLAKAAEHFHKSVEAGAPSRS